MRTVIFLISLAIAAIATPLQAAAYQMKYFDSDSLSTATPTVVFQKKFMSLFNVGASHTVKTSAFLKAKYYCEIDSDKLSRARSFTIFVFDTRSLSDWQADTVEDLWVQGVVTERRIQEHAEGSQYSVVRKLDRSLLYVDPRSKNATSNDFFATPGNPLSSKKVARETFWSMGNSRILRINFANPEASTLYLEGEPSPLYCTAIRPN